MNTINNPAFWLCIMIIGHALFWSGYLCKKNNGDALWVPYILLCMGSLGCFIGTLITAFVK